MRNFIYSCCFLGLASLYFAGCGNSAGKSLLLAESLTWEHPDSALAILDSIPESSLKSDRERAIHTILTTEARYKSGFDDVDNSLISLAANHFENDDKNPYRLKANYYKGIIEVV